MKLKQLFSLLILIGISINLEGQDKVASGVYSWPSIKKGEKEIFSGSSTHFQSMELNAVALKSGKRYKENYTDSEFEYMLIVKAGEVEVSLNEATSTVGSGSIMLVLPGDTWSLKNADTKTSEFYILKYKSKSKPDPTRGAESGGSIVLDFDKLEYNEHDRGGIRNYFRRKTTMCPYYEMHVTNLNGGIKSHEPHTHKAAEIVLMIKGDTGMQIGNNFFQGSEGDIYFLESDISHAIENTGTEQCMYFAYQWE